MGSTVKLETLLPESIVSPQDLASLILEVRRYNAWYQAEVIKQRTGVNAPAPAPRLSSATTELLQKVAPGGQLSPDTLTTLVTELERAMKTAPTITITLADLPSNALRVQLAHWCRTNLNAAILVEFNCNRRILGGMVIRYGSRIFDWSFRSKLLANKAAIPGVLRRV